NDLLPLRIRMRVRHPDAVEASLQAREMMREAERLAAIHRNELVHAVAVDEAAVEHRDVRLRDRQGLAVEVDDLVVVAHLSLPYFLNHKRTLSHVRPKKLASGTSSSAIIGNSAIGLPSSETLTVPTRCAREIGATGGSSACIVTASLSALPF